MDRGTAFRKLLEIEVTVKDISFYVKRGKNLPLRIIEKIPQLGPLVLDITVYALSENDNEMIERMTEVQRYWIYSAETFYSKLGNESLDSLRQAGELLFDLDQRYNLKNKEDNSTCERGMPESNECSFDSTLSKESVFLKTSLSEDQIKKLHRQLHISRFIECNESDFSDVFKDSQSITPVKWIKLSSKKTKSNKSLTDLLQLIGVPKDQIEDKALIGKLFLDSSGNPMTLNFNNNKSNDESEYHEVLESIVATIKGIR